MLNQQFCEKSYKMKSIYFWMLGVDAEIFHACIHGK